MSARTSARICCWLLLSLSSAALQPDLPRPSEEESPSLAGLASALRDLERSHFPDSQQVTMTVEHARTFWLQPELLHSPRRVLSATAPADLHGMRNARSDFAVVVVGQGVKTLRTILDGFLPSSLNGAVVVVAYDLEDEEDALQTCVDELWRHGSLNSVVLSANASSDVVVAHGYTPFLNCSGAGPLQLVASWTRGLGWDGVVFPRNGKLNLNKCVLRCVTTDVPYSVVLDHGRFHGVVINIITSIADRINFTYVPQNISDGKGWGEVLANGTAIGMTGDVIDGRADIGVGEFLPFPKRYQALDMVRPYKDSCLTWAVPSGLGPGDSIWKILVDVLSPPVWLGLAASLSSSTVFVWTISRTLSLPRAHRRFRSLKFLFFYMTTTMIGVPSASPPRGTAVRSTFAMWLFFSLVMCTAYIASLRSLLAKPWVRADIRTLQGILDSQLEIAVKANYIRILKDMSTENSTLGALASAARPIWQGTDALHAAAVNRSKAVFNVHSVLEYFEARYSEPGVGARLHVLKGYCAVNYNGVPFILKKGSFLTRPLDTYLQWLIESGLIGHWVGHYTGSSGSPAAAASRSAEHAALTRRNLAGVFLLFGAGSLLSTAVFLGELVNARKGVVVADGPRVFGHLRQEQSSPPNSFLDGSFRSTLMTFKEPRHPTSSLSCESRM